MIDQKLIPEPVFAFYLQQDASQQGELLFGGVDKAHYTGDFVNVPLTSETYWEVSLDAMKFGSSAVVTSKANAIIERHLPPGRPQGAGGRAGQAGGRHGRPWQGVHH